MRTDRYILKTNKTHVIIILHEIFSHINQQVETEEEIKKMVDNSARWLYIKLDAYMNNTSVYTQVVQKHSMFYAILFTKLLYLTTSIMILYSTDRIFKIGRFATYGYDWITTLHSVKLNINYIYWNIIYIYIMSSGRCQINIIIFEQQY